MKKSSLKNEKIQGKKPVDYFLTFFLAVSLIFSIIIVTNCNNKSNDITPVNDNTRPPEFGGDESSSIVTSLFKSAAEGAAGNIGGAAAGWAMSALGLSSGSPDYTEELDKIDQDLQEIISELNAIEAELNQISQELTVINCTEWATGLSDEKSRIDALMQNYNTFIATANSGGMVTQAELSDWVDQVMASGAYTSQEPMNQILSKFAVQLYVPINSGIIPACIQTLTAPKEDSLGMDTTYYNLVDQYTNYYYAYQVKGLMLYNEALHYRAWQAAGSPNSDSLSSDSASYVCQNKNAVLFCNESAAAVNTLYNNLITQLTAGGATYSDENFILQYRQSGPVLWPLSLENFTTAAGDNCADPLTSALPCGIAANYYDKGSMKSVIYKGYTGWSIAGEPLLANLLSGWNSGTAGNYLQSNLGFKNMKNKIIISTDFVWVSFQPSIENISVTVVPFFDTDIDYSIFQGLINNSAKFQKLAPLNSTTAKHCSGGYPAYFNNYWHVYPDLPSSRNNFYDNYALEHGYFNYADEKKFCVDFNFVTEPGWYAGNKTSSAIQYQWPVLQVNQLTCTEGRTTKNAGNVWTMCGDDFTAWFDYYVPRPVTCDNAGAGVTCGLSSTAVAKAKQVFGRQTRTEVY